MIKSIKASIISLCLALLTINPVLAASTDLLVETKAGQHYQYNMVQLIRSYNNDKKLFTDFEEKLAIGQVKAYYDNKVNEYVDFSKIVRSYNENRDQFDLNKFTENAKYDDMIFISDMIQTMIEENGEVKEGQIIKNEERFDVMRIY
ncbi:hypothetical protein [Clostridium lundense]|uniref:hypothetical protein n=1 Tax=Clostridium lundense TaxID=319475 RepID=UPI0004867AC3|nr:hypothetical protein [Clostridium lundense]